MAVEKTINLNVNTKGAQKNVKDLEKSVEGVNNEVKETGASTEAMGGTLDKVTGGAVSKFTAFKGTLKGVTTGFKTMRTAIISTGLGALVVVIGSLIAAFKGSEEGQNKFAKIMTVIGGLTGNLVDLLADLGENIISAFENPKQALKDFTKLIKENIVNRFEGLLELFPKLGKAISLLFKGEFSAAGKVAADAVGKVTLGVDSVTDSFGNAVDAVKEFGKEQAKELKQAVAVANMRAKADKIERKLIVDRSKLESQIANLRLKSRQEEQFSAAERKQALLDAQKLEEELLDQETQFLELRRDAQILENTFSRSNKENLTKEAEAIAAVNRQQAARANAARQVQREVNTISKQIQAENKAAAAEQKAIEDKKIAEEKTRLDAIQKIRDDFTDKQRQKEAETELQKLALEEEKKIAELDKLKASQEQKLEVLAYYSGLRVDLEKKEQEDKQKIDKLESEAKLNMVKSTFGNISNALGKNSKEGKAFAAAQALINTYQGISAELATKTATPFEFGLKLANIASTAAIGFKSVKDILKTNPKSGGSGASVSTPTTSSQPPSFNIVGATETSQLAEAVGSQTQQPIQAYVVSNDVTSAQSLENNIVEGATLG
jgi:hypothetical protein